MFLRVWHKFWYGFSSSQIDGCSQQITYFPLRKWYLRPPFPQFRWWKTCQRFSTNVCYSCSSAFSCWKICWVCVHMVIFSMSHIKTYKNTSNIFEHFSKKPVDWQIEINPTLNRGTGCENVQFLRFGNEFCLYHCVLVIINHKTVPHINGTPLVARASVILSQTQRLYWILLAHSTHIHSYWVTLLHVTCTRTL